MYKNIRTNSVRRVKIHLNPAALPRSRFSFTSTNWSFTTFFLKIRGILQIIMYTYLMINEENQMKPVKIAICDDEEILRKTLRQKIETHCKKMGIPCRIYGFESGDKLLALPDENTPDILFLDIQMPGKNGMRTARELRSKNHDVILVFVTALPEYVYEAFDVNAFHYLVKPFDDKKLYQVLDNALRQYAERAISPAAPQNKSANQIANAESQNSRSAPRAILVKRGGLSTKVLLTDIIYAEVFNRKIMLHTVNGDIEYYGKLTDLCAQTGADFYRTHRAYLVNLQYVEKYNADTIWLDAGAVPVSKKQFAGFVRQYMQYISRTNGRGADK